MKQLGGMFLIFLVALQLSCSAFNDPAVSLAYCLEKALEKHKGEAGPILATCELDIPRSYVVVLHPDGDLTTEQLVAAGLAPSQVDVLRSLRLGSNAAIYVLSNDPATPSSRTTYQRGFVRIPKALTVAKSSTESVEVSLAGVPGDRFIESLR